MKPRLSIYIIATCLLLGACSTPEERAAYFAAKEIKYCKEAGFKEKTDAFANCRLQVRMQREQQEKADLNAALEDLGNSVHSAQPRTQVCNSTVGHYGNVSTTCY